MNSPDQHRLAADRFAYERIFDAFMGQLGPHPDEIDMEKVAEEVAPTFHGLRYLGMPDDRLEVLTRMAFRDVEDTKQRIMSMTPEDFCD